jgi:hypothetical protein
MAHSCRAATPPAHYGATQPARLLDAHYGAMILLLLLALLLLVGWRQCGEGARHARLLGWRDAPCR